MCRFPSDPVRAHLGHFSAQPRERGLGPGQGIKGYGIKVWVSRGLRDTGILGYGITGPVGFGIGVVAEFRATVVLVSVCASTNIHLSQFRLAFHTNERTNE